MKPQYSVAILAQAFSPMLVLLPPSGRGDVALATWLMRVALIVEVCFVGVSAFVQFYVMAECAGSWRSICFLRGRRALHRERRFPCFILPGRRLLHGRALRLRPARALVGLGRVLRQDIGCLRVEGLLQQDGLARVFRIVVFVAVVLGYSAVSDVC